VTSREWVEKSVKSWSAFSAVGGSVPPDKGSKQ